MDEPKEIGKNYTRPNDPDHVDNPKEWLNSALIFANALGHLLDKNTGVVVEIKGDAVNPVGKSKKVVVFNMDSMIIIDDYSGNLEEGERVSIISPEEN